MFSQTSGKRLPKLSEAYQFWSFDPKGKLVIEFLSSLPKITPSLDETPIEDIQIPRHGPAENICADHAPADRFMDGNNERLLDFDFPPLTTLYEVSESSGLPPSFVGNFCLNRVFTEFWKDADLTHALTSLDYLTNLESSRRTVLREAAQRLHINEDTWRSVLADNTEALAWVCEMQKQEDDIDICYSSLWMDLRIWTMIKELLSQPFYKPSIIAMLNTLFPPVVRNIPSLRIQGNALYKYRNAFYRYIVSIEVNSASELDKFIRKLDHPGTGHTWSDVRQALKDYIGITDSMMKQASEVHGISYFRNLPGACLTLPTMKLRREESIRSNSTSVSSKSTITSYDGLKRESIKSDRKPEIKDTGSVKSGTVNIASPTSPESKYVLPSRSRFSGKPIFQKVSDQVDIDTLFQGSPQTPQYSSPCQPSSASVHSLETNNSSERRRSVSFSRPLTPSIEERSIHRSSTSIRKPNSYEFHNALPGTPELPSPQANDKNVILATSAASQATLSVDKERSFERQHESEVQADKKKRSGFGIFRRKKKQLDSPQITVSTLSISQSDDYTVKASPNHDESGYMTPHTPNRQFVPEPQTLKKKSSFGFLQPHKSQDDVRAFGDSISDRTVTETRDQRVKPKRSLTNLFANKEFVIGGLGINVGETSSDAETTTGTISGLRHTLRKVRSFSSVRSTSSTHSNEPARKSPVPGVSSMIDEDRVITSDDIDEPFPFRNFSLPQTPAMPFEDPEELQENEDIRKALLDKARIERLAKWEQSEEFKRKLEASRQKRRLLREEIDANVQASQAARQKQKEEIEKKRAKKRLIENPSQNTSPAMEGSNKPPKTPMKERVLKIFADSYSPTSPVIK